MQTNDTRKKALRKTVAVTAFRAALLYLAYHHMLVPRQGAIPREAQKSLWWSMKNAWKMGRWAVRSLR